MIEFWEWHRENGQLMQTGYMDMDIKTGEWKRYHPNGILLDEGFLRMARKPENGKPMMRMGI